MNRKAMLAYNELIWVVRIIIVITVFVMVIAVAFYVIKLTFATEGEEMELFAYRLLYSPNGISVYDPLSNRVNPGIIDVPRLTSGEWESSIDFGRDYMAARIRIIDGKSTLWEGIYNEKMYKIWSPLSGLSGEGGVLQDTKRLPIFIPEDHLVLLRSEFKPAQSTESPTTAKGENEKTQPPITKLIPLYIEFHIITPRK